MSFTSTTGPLPPDISRGSISLIVSWLTVSIAFLFVALRFYIRGILCKILGWDDYFILLAMALAIAQSVIAIFQVQNGFGRNIEYLTPIQIQNWILHTTTLILLHTAGTLLVRISVCLFVLRLVPATKVSYRRCIWVLLTFNTIISLAIFLALCFECIPLAGLWDHSVKARCFPRDDATKFAEIQGGAAVVTDLLCVLLPMMVFRTLQASLRDKVAVFIVLGLGFLTAATAIARTALINLAMGNPTWGFVHVAICASLEQNIGIAVASMPALRQLLTIRKKQHSSHSSEPLCITRAPLNAFARLSNTDDFRLPDHDSSAQPSYREFSTPTPTPKTADIETCYDRKVTLTRAGTIPPPLWADRNLSSAETVEMSRVSPTTTTFADRKPSSADTLRLSMVVPSWRKPSCPDRASTSSSKRLSLISPLSLSLDRPPPLFSAGRMQNLGRFEETGLRHSKVVATPEEVMTLGNPAAMGYSCRIEGPAPGGTPRTSPGVPSS